MLVMGYLGAVIGAGFASGQEIVQFFVSYGLYGIRGAYLATVLFALCGGLLLYTAHNIKVSNYQDILDYLMGHRLGKAVDFFLAIFLFLGISTMLSASGAVFYEHLFLPKNVGIFLAYLLVLTLLLTGKKGLITAYNFLVPIKIVLLLLISGYVAFFVNESPTGAYSAFLAPQDSRYWLIASILYVAYNFALAMVVLTEYQTVSNRKNGVWGAVWGGTLLGVLVILNYLALSKYQPVVMHYQVPMLYVVGHISPGVKLVYTMVLWMGIITTAIANSYGFAQRFNSFTGINYKLCLFLCMTMALPLSMQSFSSLVSRIFPLFGILGVIILIGLIYRTVMNLCTQR